MSTEEKKMALGINNAGSYLTEEQRRAIQSFNESNGSSTENGSGGSGTGGSGTGGSGTGGSGSSDPVLPTVNDPDKVFADITRQEYLDYVKNYREFEQKLIEKATTDTSLIDTAIEDAAVSEKRTTDIAKRNLSRFGATLTPAQEREMQRSIERGTTLGGIQSVADARIAQRDANQKLLADLINIGQGVNRTSLAQLGSAAADATQRNNAYRQARANHRSQTYSAIGSLGATAILAAFMM